MIYLRGPPLATHCSILLFAPTNVFPFFHSCRYRGQIDHCRRYRKRGRRAQDKYFVSCRPNHRTTESRDRAVQRFGRQLTNIDCSERNSPRRCIPRTRISARNEEGRPAANSTAAQAKVSLATFCRSVVFETTLFTDENHWYGANE